MSFTALAFLTGCGAEPLPPRVPAGPPVPVRIDAPSADSEYHVRMFGSGQEGVDCKVPCVVQVPSGSTMVSVSGNRTYVEGAVIPAGPSHATFSESRRVQRIIGASLLGGGLVVGAVAVAMSQNANASPNTKLTDSIVGLTGAGVGVAGLVIALTAGRDRVTFTPDSAAAAPARDKSVVKFAGITGGPGQAGGGAAFVF